MITKKDVENYKRYKEISKNIDEETKPIVEKLSKDVTKLQNKANDEIDMLINKYYKLYKEIEEIENELKVNLDEI